MDLFWEYDSVEPVEEGWSSDKKYRVVRGDGTAYLLRVSPIERLEAKRTEYRYMCQAAESGVPMCRPAGFGTSSDGVWSLQGWIDGEGAETAVPRMSPDGQYAAGVRAGEILRRIHALPVPAALEDWEVRFNRKIERNLARYRDCPVKIDGGEAFAEFVRANRGLLRGRPQCWQHGDYHIGNLMIADGEVVVIDFDRSDFGDPWEEFNRIVFCALVSPRFAAGRVDGYFDGHPPEDFWRLLALYTANNALSSVPWAMSFWQEDVDRAVEQGRILLGWYDGMRRTVPSWYTTTKTTP
ncbi:MAG: phosphotransferase [Clostridia bacterium]|nr:phosphotransferase [Clostridia bacterium]